MINQAIFPINRVTVHAPLVSIHVFVALKQIHNISFLPHTARCGSFAACKACSIFIADSEPLSRPVVNVIGICGNTTIVADLAGLTLEKIVPSIDTLKVVIGACVLAEDLLADDIQRNGSKVIHDGALESAILITTSHALSFVRIAVHRDLSELAYYMLGYAGIKTDCGAEQINAAAQCDEQDQVLLH